MTDRGVRIGNEMLDVIPATETIRARGQWLFVEPLDWEPSKILKVVYTGKPLRGIVRAAGAGCYPLKYDGPKGKRTKSWNSKHFRPCDVQVGDVVEFGGLELRGYLFPTIHHGNTELIICRENDVAIVRDDLRAA